MTAIKLNLSEGNWFQFQRTGLPAGYQGLYRVEKSWKGEVCGLPPLSKFYTLVDSLGKQFSYIADSSDASSDSLSAIRPERGSKKRLSFSLQKGYEIALPSQPIPSLDELLKTHGYRGNHFDKSTRHRE